MTSEKQLRLDLRTLVQYPIVNYFVVIYNDTNIVKMKNYDFVYQRSSLSNGGTNLMKRGTESSFKKHIGW